MDDVDVPEDDAKVPEVAPIDPELAALEEYTNCLRARTRNAPNSQFTVISPGALANGTDLTVFFLHFEANSCVTLCLSMSDPFASLLLAYYFVFSHQQSKSARTTCIIFDIPRTDTLDDSKNRHARVALSYCLPQYRIRHGTRHR